MRSGVILAVMAAMAPSPRTATLVYRMQHKTTLGSVSVTATGQARAVRFMLVRVARFVTAVMDPLVTSASTVY
jgi:hypothetical protein